MAGRKPDYNLQVMNKETDKRGTAGAAWENDDGSISISLNACIVLTDSPALEIRLFPNTKPENKKDTQDTPEPF